MLIGAVASSSIRSRRPASRTASSSARASCVTALQSHHGRADHGAAQGEVAQLVGDALGVLAGLPGRGRVAPLRGQVGAVGQRVAQLAWLPGLSQDLDRVPILLLGQPAVGGVPGEVGDHPVPGTDRDEVTELAAQLQRLRVAAIAPSNRSVRYSSQARASSSVARPAASTSSVCRSARS